MSIDIHNYEEFLLDRFEGRLSAERERELDAFLRAHPEISRKLEDFEMISLPRETAPKDFPKEILKKNIRSTPAVAAGNYEEMMIMSVEGLLTKSQEEDLHGFLRLNPALEHDLALYRATRLKAGVPPAFPAKDKLYKKKAGLIIFRPAITGIAAASVLLIAVAIRFLFFNTEITAPAVLPAGDAPVAEAVSPPVKAADPENSLPVTTAKHSTAGVKQSDQAAVSTMTRQASFRLEPSYSASLMAEAPEAGLSIIYDRRRLRISAFTEEQAPLLARALGNFAGRVRGNLREDLGVDDAGQGNFDIWTLAAAGVKSFGTMTDRDLELYLDKNDQGKVTSYALLDDDRRILARSRPQE